MSIASKWEHACEAYSLMWSLLDQKQKSDFLSLGKRAKLHLTFRNTYSNLCAALLKEEKKNILLRKELKSLHKKLLAITVKELLMNKLILPKDTNVVDLKEVRDAKAILKVDPQDPIGPNWLQGLKKGTIFLTQQKPAQSFELITFEVIEKAAKSVRLLNETQGVRTKVWVSSAVFSKVMDLVEILGVNEGPSKEEEQNGDSDRAE